MSSEELQTSLKQYNEQLHMIKEALQVAADAEKESLVSLESDLQQLIELTNESIQATLAKDPQPLTENNTNNKPAVENAKSELDDEYALFMQEMAKTGAYEEETKQIPECSNDKSNQDDSAEDSDIEDELATLLGMKCAVYHTHKWGGQPTLYNAMVSTVEPRQDDDQFKDLQVRVLFTHPTHAEMLPCPYFLDGECRFSDEQCRYSHGAIIPLSSLKEAIEPNFETVKVGSRVLVKLKPPEGEDISLARKSTEKYLLWHRAMVRSINEEKRTCVLKLEHALNTGEKKKTISDEFTVAFEEIFPLNDDAASDSDSEDSLSDTEYPDSKFDRLEVDARALVIERSLQASGPALGEWERHTRGIGSKLMLAMGYVPGAGLGAGGAGRVLPVEARLVPPGRSLDHCMELAEKARARDPLMVEQKLKRMQKKEEDRNKRAYEREKERERRNVFNFLNNTLGDKSVAEPSTATSMPDIKQSTSKDLNIEQFKINEETKRIEREIGKLNSSLQRQSTGSSGHRGINVQLAEKNKELNILRNKEQQIAKEQRHRQDKQKMTVF